MRPYTRLLPVAAAAAVAASLTLQGCAERADAADPGPRRQYGPAVRVGDGQARTYVVRDGRAGGAPLEIGVALDEAALEGLPAAHGGADAAGGSHDHSGSKMYDLALPARHGTPYRFVQMDWNPGGHEPAGVYDTPHFDFHFYTITPAERDAIDPAVIGEAEFTARGNRLPPEAERADTYVPLSPPGGPLVMVPRMGVHWATVHAPELQGLMGRPEAARPFTTTFLRGSWDGRVTFDEPMVTRAFILGRKTAPTAAQRDSVMPLTAAPRVRPAGRYPAAYRVAYDARAREYRIALTKLARRE